jgi:hypothetical protein
VHERHRFQRFSSTWVAAGSIASQPVIKPSYVTIHVTQISFFILRYVAFGVEPVAGKKTHDAHFVSDINGVGARSDNHN